MKQLVIAIATFTNTSAQPDKTCNNTQHRALYHDNLYHDNLYHKNLYHKNIAHTFSHIFSQISGQQPKGVGWLVKP
jgi:hypothetical protein